MLDSIMKGRILCKIYKYFEIWTQFGKPTISFKKNINAFIQITLIVLGIEFKKKYQLGAELKEKWEGYCFYLWEYKNIRITYRFLN